MVVPVLDVFLTPDEMGTVCTPETHSSAHLCSSSSQCPRIFMNNETFPFAPSTAPVFSRQKQTFTGIKYMCFLVFFWDFQGKELGPRGQGHMGGISAEYMKEVLKSQYNYWVSSLWDIFRQKTKF